MLYIPEKPEPNTEPLTPFRRGQAIAFVMLHFIEDGPLGRNAALRPAEPRDNRFILFSQDNVLLRYLQAIRAFDNPEIEAGFCSAVSGYLSDAALGNDSGSDGLRRTVNLTRKQLAVVAKEFPLHLVEFAQKNRAPSAVYGAPAFGLTWDD